MNCSDHVETREDGQIGQCFAGFKKKRNWQRYTPLTFRLYIHYILRAGQKSTKIPAKQVRAFHIFIIHILIGPLVLFSGMHPLGPMYTFAARDGANGLVSEGVCQIGHPR